MPSSTAPRPRPRPLSTPTPTPTTAPTLTGVQAIALKRSADKFPSPPSQQRPSVPPLNNYTKTPTAAKSPFPLPEAAWYSSRQPPPPLLVTSTDDIPKSDRSPQLHYRADLARSSAAASSEPTSEVQTQTDCQKVPQFNCRPASRLRLRSPLCLPSVSSLWLQAQVQVAQSELQPESQRLRRPSPLLLQPAVLPRPSSPYCILRTVHPAHNHHGAPTPLLLALASNLSMVLCYQSR